MIETACCPFCFLVLQSVATSRMGGRRERAQGISTRQVAAFGPSIVISVRRRAEQWLGGLIVALPRNGRGQMTNGRTGRGADRHAACAFPVRDPWAVIIPGGTRAASTIGAGERVQRERNLRPRFERAAAPRATPLKASAAQGATCGRPARRSMPRGARRHGEYVYGNEENAGGCHPPGRDPDRRHQRQ